MRYFTHLHLHTEYSLLDGANRLEDVIAFAKEHELPAIGISDHGNIFGAVKFFQMAKRAGIKPILGIEAYVTEDGTIRDANNPYYHLLIIVKDKIGYQNLCKLISYSYQDGFYFKPRIDYRMLEKHSEGLIVSTACLGGHIPKLLLNGQEKEVYDRIDWYISVFGKDCFYFEIMPEEQEEQKVLNKKLTDLSKELNIKMIATCDAHYLDMSYHEAHEVMLCIPEHSKLDDKERLTFGNIKAYMRTPHEMLELFKDNQQAVYNTGVIADRCDFDFESLLHFPQFEVPADYTQESYFRKLCKEGLEKLIQDERINENDREKYEARLNEEIELIVKMGFVGYLLIVGDFCRWARQQGIPVGPGRGSAAGSLAVWCLDITNLDPLKYNLLFERFLNPERVSMPDIDIDFCIQEREKVFDYCRDKYGHDKVCQIATFGTMKSKGVIKDVARVLGISYGDADTITKLIPKETTLKEALEAEPRLQQLIDQNENIKKLFDLSFKLEGLTRHASRHAAGIVISPEAVAEVLPVFNMQEKKSGKRGALRAQYAKDELESLGFLKIDLLGLQNLTLVKQVLRIIERDYSVSIDVDKLDLNDSITYKLLSAGDTTGVFQLESDGIKEVLRKLQPSTFEDIVAVNALYRPGPLGSGMVDDFIERRHGRQKISYLLPELEPILKETYGVIVYQEQVMKIASAIAGYSLGEADILRRAMGKKKVDVMTQQRELFLSRAQERGTDEKKAGELFDLMAYFAGYGFNKSHSAAYSLISYQTAYLKAHYPAEFMACLISLEADDANKMISHLQEAQTMGLPIAPVDINQSEANFIPKNNGILYGFKGVNKLGEKAIANILELRKKAPFASFEDFCSRVNKSLVNEKIMKHLIYAGAFDSFNKNRAQLLSDYMYKKTHRIPTKQIDVFNTAPQEDKIEPWNFAEQQGYELEALGLYLKHPLTRYKKELKQLNITPISKLPKEGKNVCCGFLKKRRDVRDRNGNLMSFIELEDESGSIEITIFAALYKNVEATLSESKVFIASYHHDVYRRNGSHKDSWVADNIVSIEHVFDRWLFKKLLLELPENYNPQLIKEIKALLKRGTIPLEITCKQSNKQLQIETLSAIATNNSCVAALEKLGVQVRLSL